MGTRKRKDTIPFWMSARADCKELRFIQCGNSLLLSKEFQSLSAGARFMYLCMAMESAGRREFTFPQKAAKKYGIPPASMRRYIDELVARGYIEKQSMANLRQPNEYRFSMAWKGVAEWKTERSYCESQSKS